MSKFKQNMNNNGLMALVIFFLYINATISGSLFHNHKPLACDHNSNTNEHASCKDSCPVCSFLAVNHSTVISNHQFLTATKIPTLIQQLSDVLIVKKNKWAFSIISRAPPFFSY